MEPKLTAHLFVCTNDRGLGAKRESCCPKGSEELRAKVKAACKGISGVRINSSGCLDQCEHGIAAVLYPEGKWFLGLKNDDASVSALVQAVEAAVNKG